MCNPAIAPALTAAASVASLGISAVSAFSRQGAAQSNFDQTIANANRALAQNYNAIQARQNQEADRASSESFDVVRQMAEVKGRATASAGEAGIGGVSFANLVSDYEMKEGRARANIDYNYATTTQDLQAQAEASRAKAASIIASTPRPDSFGLLADLAGSGIKAGLKIYDAFDDRSSGSRYNLGADFSRTAGDRDLAGYN